MPTNPPVQPKYTAANILARAAVFLNNPSADIFTPTKLLPFLTTAWQELEGGFLQMGSPIMNTYNDLEPLPPSGPSVNPYIEVVASSQAQVLYSYDPWLYMIYPIRLEERLSGSSDDYVPMTKVAWPLPSGVPAETLRFWAFIRNNIYVPPVTTNRDIRLSFKKLMDDIDSTSDELVRPEAFLFLAYRTAALAAAYQGENYTRAEALANSAELEKDNVLRLAVFEMQGRGYRRRPYRPNSKMALRRVVP